MAKRRVLVRGSVVAKAAELADAAGSVQAVTLTTLAAALDIRVPSLYNHISNLDDLHDALASYALQELLTQVRAAAMGKVGEAALIAIAHAYRTFAQAHPGIYPLTLRAPAPDNAAHVALAQELIQTLLLVFASLGVQGEDAIHAIRGMRALMHGFVSLEAGEGFKMAVDLDESFRRILDIYWAGLMSRQEQDIAALGQSTKL